MVHGLALHDNWKQNPVRPTYTHHSPSGATRVDRVYAAQEMMEKTRHRNPSSSIYGSSRTSATPCSGNTRRKEGQRQVEDELHAVTGRKNQGKDPSQVGDMEESPTLLPGSDLVVGTLCKKQLRYFMRQEEAERNKDHRQMENHLYERIYDILRSNTPQEEKLPAFKRYKS